MYDNCNLLFLRFFVNARLHVSGGALGYFYLRYDGQLCFSSSICISYLFEYSIDVSI
jgi:hypothetical protein